MIDEQNECLRPLNGFDAFFSLLVICMLSTIPVAIFSVVLNKNFGVSESGVLFIVLSLISVFLLLILKHMSLTNKRRSKKSQNMLEKLNKLYFISDSTSVWDYCSKLEEIEKTKKEELMNNESFIKTCLKALKDDCDEDFIKYKSTIIWLSEKITQEKIKKQEDGEKVRKMHNALFNKDIESNFDLKIETVD